MSRPRLHIRESTRSPFAARTAPSGRERNSTSGVDSKVADMTGLRAAPSPKSIATRALLPRRKRGWECQFGGLGDARVLRERGYVRVRVTTRWWVPAFCANAATCARKAIVSWPFGIPGDSGNLCWLYSPLAIRIEATHGCDNHEDRSEGTTLRLVLVPR